MTSVGPQFSLNKDSGQQDLQVKVWSLRQQEKSGARAGGG